MSKTLLIQIFAQARAHRVMRELKAQHSDRPSVITTEAAYTPTESPEQETPNGAT
jgi:hypothetical protein